MRPWWSLPVPWRASYSRMGICQACDEFIIRHGSNRRCRRKEHRTMEIRACMSTSADGYVTTPGGWPALTADPAFVSGESHGIRDFLSGCEAALMGRTTFEPALTNERWPWPDLNVFVLGSHRPSGTPDHVITDSDPARLLEKLRETNRGGDVHLVGGPRTIETFRVLGALDKLELVVLPLLLGAGMRLTPSLNPETGLTFERERALPGGSVEIVYTVNGSAGASRVRPAAGSPQPQRSGRGPGGAQGRRRPRQCPSLHGTATERRRRHRSTHSASAASERRIRTAFPSTSIRQTASRRGVRWAQARQLAASSSSPSRRNHSEGMMESLACPDSLGASTRASAHHSGRVAAGNPFRLRSDGTGAAQHPRAPSPPRRCSGAPSWLSRPAR